MEKSYKVSVIKKQQFKFQIGNFHVLQLVLQHVLQPQSPIQRFTLNATICLRSSESNLFFTHLIVFQKFWSPRGAWAFDELRRYAIKGPKY